MVPKTKKRDTAPRKIPSQKRARENVERILGAAASLLDKRGYDYLTTITIAKESGASVGSLYQYFPNKHAIMLSLVERWLVLDDQALEEVEKQEYSTVTEKFLALTAELVKGYLSQKGLHALVSLTQNIPELHDMVEKHDRRFAVRLTESMDALEIGDEEKLVLAGYYTLLVDAMAMSIATESKKRAKLKMEFLNNSVHDMFRRHL